jgi:hypothetical protein
MGVDCGGGDDDRIFRGARGRNGKGGDRDRTERGGAKRKAAEMISAHGVSSFG